ncbi:MAG: hypothetical protein JW946_05800, partial [Candidatus Omnitrophica bacterium]|nr:hypothetical protein [Candidatus Omnitrophota bacterium]
MGKMFIEDFNVNPGYAAGEAIVLLLPIAKSGFMKGASITKVMLKLELGESFTPRGIFRACLKVDTRAKVFEAFRTGMGVSISEGATTMVELPLTMATVGMWRIFTPRGFFRITSLLTSRTLVRAYELPLDMSTLGAWKIFAPKGFSKIADFLSGKIIDLSFRYESARMAKASKALSYESLPTLQESANKFKAYRDASEKGTFARQYFDNKLAVTKEAILDKIGKPGTATIARMSKSEAGGNITVGEEKLQLTVSADLIDAANKRLLNEALDTGRVTLREIADVDLSNRDATLQLDYIMVTRGMRDMAVTILEVHASTVIRASVDVESDCRRIQNAELGGRVTLSNGETVEVTNQLKEVAGEKFNAVNKAKEAIVTAEKEIIDAHKNMDSLRTETYRAEAELSSARTEKAEAEQVPIDETLKGEARAKAEAAKSQAVEALGKKVEHLEARVKDLKTQYERSALHAKARLLDRNEQQLLLDKLLNKKVNTDLMKPSLDLLSARVQDKIFKAQERMEQIEKDRAKLKTEKSESGRELTKEEINSLKVKLDAKEEACKKEIEMLRAELEVYKAAAKSQSASGVKYWIRKGKTEADAAYESLVEDYVKKAKEYKRAVNRDNVKTELDQIETNMTDLKKEYIAADTPAERKEIMARLNELARKRQHYRELARVLDKEREYLETVKSDPNNENLATMAGIIRVMRQRIRAIYNEGNMLANAFDPAVSGRDIQVIFNARTEQEIALRNTIINSICREVFGKSEKQLNWAEKDVLQKEIVRVLHDHGKDLSADKWVYEKDTYITEADGTKKANVAVPFNEDLYVKQAMGIEVCSDGNIMYLKAAGGKSEVLSAVFGRVGGIGELLVGGKQEKGQFLGKYQKLARAYGFEYIDASEYCSTGNYTRLIDLINDSADKNRNIVLVFDTDTAGHMIQAAKAVGGERLAEALDRINAIGADEVDLLALSRKAYRIATPDGRQVGSFIKRMQALKDTIEESNIKFKPYSEFKEAAHSEGYFYTRDPNGTIKLSDGLDSHLRSKGFERVKFGGSEIQNALRAKYEIEEVPVSLRTTGFAEDRPYTIENGSLQVGTSDSSSVYNFVISMYENARRIAHNETPININEMNFSETVGEATVSQMFSSRSGRRLVFGGSATLDVAGELSTIITGSKVVEIEPTTWSTLTGGTCEIRFIESGETVEMIATSAIESLGKNGSEGKMGRGSLIATKMARDTVISIMKKYISKEVAEGRIDEAAEKALNAKLNKIIGETDGQDYLTTENSVGLDNRPQGLLDRARNENIPGSERIQVIENYTSNEGKVINAIVKRTGEERMITIVNTKGLRALSYEGDVDMVLADAQNMTIG